MPAQYTSPVSPYLANTRIKNLLGLKFGRLFVLQFAKRNAHGEAMWLCVCRCLTTKIVRGTDLVRSEGHTSSCGCLARELVARRQFRHGAWVGGKGTPEYAAYNSAKRRCTNPNDANYKRYGGRGIEFHFQSFQDFIAELGPRHSSKHSVERINNNGHYEVGNVRWATMKEQAQNRRMPDRAYRVRITANGQTKTLLEWSKQTSATVAALYLRKERGWCDPCTINIRSRPRVHKGCPHR